MKNIIITNIKTIVFSLFVFSVSFCVVLAWTGPEYDPPTPNISAPINVGVNPQVKEGSFQSETDIRAPIFYDYPSTDYYVDPDANSWLQRLYSHDIRPKEFYDLDNITGLSNGYSIDLEGVSEFNTIKLGGVERSDWPSEGSSLWSENGSNIYYSNGNVGINKTSPSQKLDVNGYVKGTALCIDSDCRNSWPSTSGDNLGNHLATQSLNMNSHDINSVGELSANGIVVGAGGISGAVFNISGLGLGTFLSVDTDIIISENLRVPKITTTRVVDTDNSTYFVDPSALSVFKDLRVDRNVFASRFYDVDNITYYINANQSSKIDFLYLRDASFTSDRTLKKNIQKIDNSLDKIVQLEGVSFEWKNEENEENREGLNLGLIAQDVEEIFPEVVSTDIDTGLKSLAYSKLIAPVIEAIKELSYKIEVLFNKYLDQQKQIDSLELKIKALENKIR